MTEKYRRCRLNEGVYYDEKDIYHNWDRFRGGDINLCFIVGHSGSGKTSVSRYLAEEYSADVCEMDMLYYVILEGQVFPLEETGELLGAFVYGEGSHLHEVSKKIEPGNLYQFWVDCLAWFLRFAMRYASFHRDRRFIVEGVHILDFLPSEFREYAVFVKGTSLISSKMRQTYRDRLRKANAGIAQNGSFTEDLLHEWEYFESDERKLAKFREYFSGLG